MTIVKKTDIPKKKDQVFQKQARKYEDKIYFKNGAQSQLVERETTQ